MIKLSVNVNKIATLRNSRGEKSPSVTSFAQESISAGAHGITVHPRPDGRHIQKQDVLDLRHLIHSPIEYNIEGYPDERYQRIIAEVTPDQATLVPDPPNALTSDSGWDVIKHTHFLKDIIQVLNSVGAARISLFIGTDLNQIEAAKKVGADRIELYTKPFADSFEAGNELEVFKSFATAAKYATEIGLGVNAGHDLNLINLRLLKNLPGLLEVSIGHALVCDALMMGWKNTIQAYLDVLNLDHF